MLASARHKVDVSGDEGAAPLLSVVLATDTYETIRPVLSALARQRFAHQIEPVIVLPAGAEHTVRREELSAFPSLRVVVVDAVVPLSAPRAAGVRAASAPIVFIGETHSYPQAGWAEALLAAFEQPWTAVVPAISNANPTGMASRASYLFDYGIYHKNRTAGEMADPLTYNTAFRRGALMAVGPQLACALDPSHEALWPKLRAEGHRAAFAPDARILHLNVGSVGSLVLEKFCAGAVLGMCRAARWKWHRRLAYLLASPLIPAVLLVRVVRDSRGSRPRALTVGTLPALMLAAVAKALGEAFGYAGVTLPSFEARLSDIEIHKVRYAGRQAP